MGAKWTAADLPRLDGRRAIVTGANRGLGLVIATALAGAGAEVVLACRDPARAQAALAQAHRVAPGARVSTAALDLADLASVRRFAEAMRTSPALDLLINNASAILVPQGRTRDGFETHIGTNHLGHFALTALLLPLLRAAPAARIVNTSSLAHRMTPGLDPEDLNVERVAYQPMDAYGRSKQAALLFTFELDRRLRAAQLPLLAVAAHPGWTNTNPGSGGFLMRLSNALMAQSVAMGALPALYAAAAPGVEGGAFYGPGGLQQLRGSPTRVACRADAREPARAAALWQRSCALAGVTPDLAA